MPDAQSNMYFNELYRELESIVKRLDRIETILCDLSPSALHGRYKWSEKSSAALLDLANEVRSKLLENPENG